MSSARAAVVAVLPTVGADRYGMAVAFTGLRQVEGTSFGGYASVDAVDCGD